MTQMLLFDSITDHAPIVTPTTTAAAHPSAERPPVVEQGVSTDESQSYQQGVNHMGDLARLVLLRYDLVAARRARRAAK